MKKLVLSLALVAFIGGGTLFAMTTQSSNSEIIEMTQDGKKKKSTATKKDCATKKDECKGEKAKTKDCSGNDVLKKKSCCSDGKAATTTKSKPEKK